MNTTLSASRAWQAFVGHLQMEMSRASFDRWVKDSELVSYEDGVFTVGVANRFARDWLADRVTAMAQRRLSGLMARQVKVRFVVRQPASEAPDALPGDEPDEGAQPSSPVADDVLLKLLYSSLEEAILRPERVVPVPGYFLRWLPYLGPGRAWVVVALRQAFYRTYGKAAFARAPFEASGAQVARWAGMSRQTVQNYLRALNAGNDMLAWFVTCVGGGEGRANTYQFRLAMPLTPGDADRLRDWLHIHGAKTDPLAAVQQALECQPKEILPYPGPMPTREQLQREPDPRTVRQVVLESCEAQVGDEVYRGLAPLARKLETRLMPPQDQVILSHYFLLNWLPLLGAGPAWMITLLRDRCYHNHHTGELRDELSLEDGYQELARALGLKRAKTIGDWLPPLEEMARRAYREETLGGWRQRQRIRKYVGLFLEKRACRFDHAGQEATRWELKVSLGDPLTPAHVRAKELLAVLVRMARAGESTWLDALLDERWGGEVEARFSQGLRRGFDRLGGVEARFLQGLRRDFDRVEARFLQGWGANLTGSEEVEARFLQGLRRDFHTLKLLIKHLSVKHLKHLINHHPDMIMDREEASAETRPDSGVVVGGNDRGWGKELLTQLLDVGGMSVERRRKVCAQIGRSPYLERFIGWTLYGYANKTSGERRGIDAPVLFALSRYRNSAPEAVYLELAGLTPGKLRRAIERAWNSENRKQRVLVGLRDNGFLEVLDALLTVRGIAP